MVFTLAMVLHPHVWKRAQAEIDAIVGTTRLPDFSDRSALPYVEAIIRETIRWHPVVPLGKITVLTRIILGGFDSYAGVWHATTGSDIYNDYYIPKGTLYVFIRTNGRQRVSQTGATVVANAWYVYFKFFDSFKGP